MEDAGKFYAPFCMGSLNIFQILVCVCMCVWPLKLFPVGSEGWLYVQQMYSFPAVSDLVQGCLPRPTCIKWWAAPETVQTIHTAILQKYTEALSKTMNELTALLQAQSTCVSEFSSRHPANGWGVSHLEAD